MFVLFVYFLILVTVESELESQTHALINMSSLNSYVVSAFLLYMCLVFQYSRKQAN